MRADPEHETVSSRRHIVELCKGADVRARKTRPWASSRVRQFTFRQSMLVEQPVVITLRVCRFTRSFAEEFVYSGASARHGSLVDVAGQLLVWMMVGPAYGVGRMCLTGMKHTVAEWPLSSLYSLDVLLRISLYPDPLLGILEWCSMGDVDAGVVAGIQRKEGGVRHAEHHRQDLRRQQRHVEVKGTEVACWCTAASVYSKLSLHSTRSVL